MLKKFFEWLGGTSAPLGPSFQTPVVEEPPCAPCPFCLEEIPIQSASTQYCPSCQFELPALYAERAIEVPSCPIEVCGLTNHGKSVYLLALTWALDRIAGPWRELGYTCTPPTEPSRDRLKQVRAAQLTGEMPQATPLRADEVYLLLLSGLARWNQRSVMMRDFSGEYFAKFRFDTSDHRKYFSDSPCTFMFVSLPDLEKDPATSMDMLLTSYIETLLSQKVPEDRKNLILILSKGDQVKQLPQHLRSHLMDDPLAAFLSTVDSSATRGRKFDEIALEAYLDGMHRAHAEIENWLLNSGWATQFVQLARQRSFSTRYCLVSSTGAPVAADNRLGTVWSPKRVLDPLFWALKLTENRA